MIEPDPSFAMSRWRLAEMPADEMLAAIMPRTTAKAARQTAHTANVPRSLRSA